MKDLKNVKCFLLDMDGTICLDNDVFDGAVEAVDRMRAQGKVLFLTNNSSKSAIDYVNKLNKMGFNVTEEDVYTSAMATISYLNAEFSNRKVFLFANATTREEFRKGGVILEEENPDLIVIAYDTTFDYPRLEKLCNFIREGVPFMCTHDDINCPTVTGYKPDVGAYLALIEKSTGKKPFAVCGKPYTVMGDCIKRTCNLSSHEIAMFGDRLATDITFGVVNDFVSVMVLTGEATLSDAEKSGLKIDYILPSIVDWDRK